MKFVVATHTKTFRCTNKDFYVALGSSMGLAVLVWVGGGLFYAFFGNKPSLGQKSPILHLPPLEVLYLKKEQNYSVMSCSCFS